ncbi:Chitin synthase, class 2, partial [Cladochytrium tenue]
MSSSHLSDPLPPPSERVPAADFLFSETAPAVLPASLVDVTGVAFAAARVVYLLAVVLVFVASLGNRPQASRALYALCFTVFAAIMAAMLLLSAVAVGRALQAAAAAAATAADDDSGVGWGSIQALVLGCPAAGAVLAAVAGTYGTYLLASLLFLSPWHMLTSSVQYFLLLPSFTNILNVYA